MLAVRVGPRLAQISYLVPGAASPSEDASLAACGNWCRAICESEACLELKDARRVFVAAGRAEGEDERAAVAAASYR